MLEEKTPVLLQKQNSTKKKTMMGGYLDNFIYVYLDFFKKISQIYKGCRY